MEGAGEGFRGKENLGQAHCDRGEKNTNLVTQSKPEKTMTPPKTPLIAKGAMKAVKASNVAKTTIGKTTEDLEVARNAPARDKTDDTTKNANAR